MLAIHNYFYFILQSQVVANAFAKLSKCQQFTTARKMSKLVAKLQTLLQSYQNVSNSQLFSILLNFYKSCKRFCKVIKMLAIHNKRLADLLVMYVANAFAKLSKCQQFTTSFCTLLCRFLLQTLLQSYQNVSNSQHSSFFSIFSLCCKRFCKVIKMLAIHNLPNFPLLYFLVANAFAKLSKCQQFTT